MSENDTDETTHPELTLAGAQLLPQLVAHLREHRAKLREQWSARIREAHLLEAMTRTGTHAASALAHARILLLADQGEAGDGEPDEVIAEAAGVSAGTVARVRKRFVTAGLEDALHRRRPTGRQYRKLDGAQEAAGGTAVFVTTPVADLQKALTDVEDDIRANQ